MIALLLSCAVEAPLLSEPTPPVPASAPAACALPGWCALPLSGPVLGRAEGSGWSAVARDGWVRLEPAGIHVHPVGALYAIAAEGDAVWAALGTAGVARISASDGSVQPVWTGGDIRDVAVHGGRVWAADVRGRVVAVDGAGRVEERALDGRPRRVWVDAGELYVDAGPTERGRLEAGAFVPVEVEPPARPVEGALLPTSIAARADGTLAVGLASGDRGSVWIVGTEPLEVLHRFDAPGPVLDLAAAGEALWVASVGLGRIDGDAYRTVALEGEPLAGVAALPGARVVAVGAARGVLVADEGGILEERPWSLPVPPVDVAARGEEWAVVTGLIGRLVRRDGILALPGPASEVERSVRTSTVRAAGEHLLVSLPGRGVVEVGDRGATLLDGVPGAFDAAPLDGGYGLALGRDGVGVWTGALRSCPLPGVAVRVAHHGGALWVLSGSVLVRMGPC